MYEFSGTLKPTLVNWVVWISVSFKTRLKFQNETLPLQLVAMWTIDLDWNCGKTHKTAAILKQGGNLKYKQIRRSAFELSTLMPNVMKLAKVSHRNRETQTGRLIVEMQNVQSENKGLDSLGQLRLVMYEKKWLCQSLAWVLVITSSRIILE